MTRTTKTVALSQKSKWRDRVLTFVAGLKKGSLNVQLSAEPHKEHTAQPEWRRLYQEALLELDDKKLKPSIAAAETAILRRLQAISGDSNHRNERQSIEDALSALRVLKRSNE